MTNEDKIQKENEIANYKAQLTPFYKAQEKNLIDFNLELETEITKLTNSPLPIKVNINNESISFYVVVDGKYRSEINIYNYYKSYLSDSDYYAFNPELSTSGVRISYRSEKNSEELTKLKVVTFLGTELENYFTENVGSKFITRLVECFTELRTIQKEITKISISVSTIERELSEAKKTESLDNFNASFKEGNWYHLKYNSLHVATGRWNKTGNYEVYYHITKISTKTVTIEIFHVKGNYQLENKRVPLEDIYDLLKNESLLTESPLQQSAN